jgi:hypothetical protein
MKKTGIPRNIEHFYPKEFLSEINKFEKIVEIA